MIEEQEIVKDPFALSEFDEETELRALVRGLQLANEFALIFACCNQAPHRRELMASVHSSLPDFNIQEIHLSESIPHLLNLLRQEIQTPAPDAIFVSGIEYSLPVAAEAHNTPFVANLNASRNSFRQAVPCPLVLWLPEYALTAIMRGAPDFFSVRSGIYYFLSSAKEISALIEKLPSDDYREIGGLSYQEKLERLAAMESLLTEYEALPEDKRDYKAEIRLNDKLSDLYENLGRFNEAVKNTKHSSAIKERVLGLEHPDTATSYNNLAGLYDSQGKYEESEQLYKKALDIYERALGLEHPDTALSYNNLASLYYTQGRYKEAELLFKKALDISERALGLEHPDIADSYNNLASVYHAQGRNKEALSLLEKALDIYEKALGLEHPDTAISYNNLAELYYSQHKYKEAEPLFKKALDIYEKALGLEHPDTAISYNNLAGLYDAQGRYEEAKALCQKALNILEKVLGKEHPLTKTALKNYQSLMNSIKP